MILLLLGEKAGMRAEVHLLASQYLSLAPVQFLDVKEPS